MQTDQEIYSTLSSTDNAVMDAYNQPAESIQVSTDNFGILNIEGDSLKGNGSGDIVLVLNDYGGKSLRKKTFMLDLSYKKNDGSVSDLTCNDLLNNRKKLIIFNDDLSAFIKGSSNQNAIQWQVFGILNHYRSSQSIKDLNYINYGLIISEKNRPKKALNFRENHRDKSLHANLILENNRYGIVSNKSLISFSSEESAFTQSLYGSLQNGSQATSSLNKKMYLGAHKLHVNYEPNIGSDFVFSSYTNMGSVELSFNKIFDQWHIIFTPR